MKVGKEGIFVQRLIEDGEEGQFINYKVTARQKSVVETDLPDWLELAMFRLTFTNVD